MPKLFLGPVASAGVVLRDPTRRDYLRKKFGVKAVEMEGSGVADATWTMGLGYLVIRGTCDYCNETKNNRWHKYASLVAASFAKCVVELMPSR